MAILIWIKNIIVLIISLFFLIIGINTLVGSYQLKNPFEFVMYFFSASLLILVCIAGLIYFFFRTFFRKQKNEINNDDSK
jgi:uncharacterized membrane protein YesL